MELKNRPDIFVTWSNPRMTNFKNVTSEWCHNETAIVFNVILREDIVFCPP